jgi:hypothetical protein
VEDARFSAAAAKRPVGRPPVAAARPRDVTRCVMENGGMQIEVGDGSVRVLEETTWVDEGRRARKAASRKMSVPQNFKML